MKRVAAADGRRSRGAGGGHRAGIGWLVRVAFFKPNTITAYFTSATAIYPGDEVRVAGVKVGTIESIEPRGPRPNWCWPSIAKCRSRPMPRP